jgi:hypothetical protein
MLQEFQENYEDHKMYDKYVCMIKYSEKPIYHGCKPNYKNLATMLEFLQVKQKKNWMVR